MNYSAFPGRKRNVLSYFYIPFLCSVLLIGIFSLVWLRSSVISMEYSISEMETLRKEALREKKAIEAEMAALVSIAYLEDEGLAFPDRKRVFYVKKHRGEMPYAASFSKD